VKNVQALAKYALTRGDATEAERLLGEVLPLAIETGGWMVADVYLYLTRAFVQQGALDRAGEALAAMREAIPAEDAYAQAAMWLAEAAVATERGDEALALRCYEDALAALEKQDFVTDLGETRVEYARALRRFGDDEGARAQLEMAREIFSRTGALGLLAGLES